MVAEGLNGMIRRAKVKNLYNGYQVDSNNVDISILQYADDTIFFGESNMENVK